MGEKKLDEISKSQSLRLTIYGYTDYRTYLKDFYSLRKSGHRGYSYRNFSKAAGFSSPNVLKLVMDGQRNVSPEAVEMFLIPLGLKGSMAEYFRVLVKMNQTKLDNEKQTHFEQLRKLTPQSCQRDLHPEQLDYLSNWLNPVLREMIQLDEFHEDPYWLSRRLNSEISAPEIARAFKFLIDTEFIKKDFFSEKHVAEDNMVVSSDEISSLGIRNYHRQMLGLAVEKLERLPMDQREFAALTFALPESAMAELKQKLKTFRSELHKWAMQVAEGAPKDAVVQVNMQMFPHTRKMTS